MGLADIFNICIQEEIILKKLEDELELDYPCIKDMLVQGYTDIIGIAYESILQGVKGELSD